MLITTTGGKKHQRDIVMTVGSFMMQELLPKIRKCDVQIRIKNLDKDMVDGYCHDTEDPRNYLIEIHNDLGLFDFIRTLCHEFIHVKQFVLGEMEDLSSDKTRWKKRIYNEETTPYEKQPWEREAFRLQEIYIKKIFEKNLV
jgi:hypothetical protein